MLEVLQHLTRALAAGKKVAYCRLVETRGSTPQKAGAMMLVFEDGTQCGTLGGGCVEAEVKRRALAIIDTTQAEISRFQLDSDYGWDDGLICGGRMLAMIQPLQPGEIPEYFAELIELSEQGRAYTEAIAYDDSVGDLPAAASFLFDEAGSLLASTLTIHSISRVTAVVHSLLRDIEERPRPYTAKGISFLPTFPRHRLLIVGGGHVGAAVADLAADLDFEVWVTDDREDMVHPDRFPKASQRLAGPVGQVLPELEITSGTYCLIVTRGHNHDEEALYHLIDRGAAYVGMIGSRRKIRLIFDDLIDQGIPPAALDNVFAPVGLEIGSQTVPEIAVSIAAELVAHRNLGGQVPARPPCVELPLMKCELRS